MRKPVAFTPDKKSRAETLSEYVKFYQDLDEYNKKNFEERVAKFLSRTVINGIGTEVTDEDKILVAASAIIPIFAFPDWEYRNVDEVLIYKNTFDRNFSQTDKERNVLGMVGEGVMNNTMILSQQALRNSFKINDGHNTAIHEFAHLLDKADGSIDGIPEYLMNRQEIAPWLELIKTEIEHIRENKKEHRDINSYAGTNQAEFFAVITEYFFEKPDQLKEHHPELYEDLKHIFTNPNDK